MGTRSSTQNNDSPSLQVTPARGRKLHSDFSAARRKSQGPTPPGLFKVQNDELSVGGTTPVSENSDHVWRDEYRGGGDIETGDRSRSRSRTSGGTHSRNQDSKSKNDALNNANIAFADLNWLIGKSKEQPPHVCQGEEFNSHKPGEVCCFRAKMNMDYVHNIRMEHAERTPTEKKEFIKQILADSVMKDFHTNPPTSTLLKVRLPSVEEPVCRNCFEVLYRVPSRTMYEYWRVAESGGAGAEASGGSGGGFQKNGKGLGEHINNFLEGWIEDHGEDNPRIKEKMVDKVAVKHIKSDAEHYFDMRGESMGLTQRVSKSRKTKGKLEWFSESYFYKLWRNRLRRGHLGNTLLPKVSFTNHKRVSSKCFACAHLAKMDEEAKGQPGAKAKREYYAYQKLLHARFYVLERLCWHRMVCRAMDSPEVTGCATADGMDSVKSSCPLFPHFQGELDGKYKDFLKVKLTGGLGEAYRSATTSTCTRPNRGSPQEATWRALHW